MTKTVIYRSVESYQTMEEAIEIGKEHISSTNPIMSKLWTAFAEIQVKLGMFKEAHDTATLSLQSKKSESFKNNLDIVSTLILLSECDKNLKR